MMSHPRPAATVALLRDSDAGPEVFMMKRSARSPFMPDVHVFPGGRVDPQDQAVRGSGGAVEAARMQRADARAYQMAAVRETVEEAGVLLGQGTPQWRDRQDLQSGRVSFSELVQRHGWQIDLDRLVYWAWWITPEAEPRRYDTRFFVARVSRKVRAAHDEHETVQSSWWTPGEALRRFDDGQINLSPPTLCTLLELQGADDVQQLLVRGRARAPVAIMPRTRKEADGAFTVLLPGDPDHPSDTPVTGPTRVTLRKGRWMVHR